MKNKTIVLIVLAASIFAGCTFDIESPTYLKDFIVPASSSEVLSFTERIDKKSEYLTREIIGYSDNGLPIVALKAAAPNPTIDPLRVLIFAQQHGNEQSGKEAALLILSDIAQKQNLHWFDNMELWIIPQMNPFGSDTNQRTNASNLDLNRDHILLQAPETRALHQLFQRIMPHVTVDIHEYQPLTESWEKFGAYKNFSVQVGTPTNPNVPSAILDFADNEILPEIEEHLISKGFSFHEYLVGPAPYQGRLRHSTVDIDDGRQSFAILGTLSLIYEGINGKDGYKDNLEERTFGQYEAILALLNLLHEKASDVLQIVEKARQTIQNAEKGTEVAVVMEHFPGNKPIRLKLLSAKTENDTLVEVPNYHPLVRTLETVKLPRAYLISANDTLIIQILDKHAIKYQPWQPLENDQVVGWEIISVTETEMEEQTYRKAELKTHKYNPEKATNSYLEIPVNQLHSYFLATILEPVSMLGIGQRAGYEQYLQAGTIYSVMRLE